MPPKISRFICSSLLGSILAELCKRVWHQLHRLGVYTEAVGGLWQAAGQPLFRVVAQELGTGLRQSVERRPDLQLAEERNVSQAPF